jgi:beta-phosphoglucomutase-like phosphatase (HAD superfamily)
MPRYSAFFFDFDGVLADTVEVKTWAFAQLFEPFGVAVRDQVIEHHRNHSGVPRADKFRYYYKHFLNQPLNNERLAGLCSAFADLVVEKVVAAPEIPGAEEFLRACHEEILCFVISGTPTEEIREIVRRRGWARYFMDVCGAPTSKKEHLDILLSRHTLMPDRCLFFGDAMTDYDASRSCKVPFIGILPGENATLLKSAPNIKWASDFRSLNFFLKK